MTRTGAAPLDGAAPVSCPEWLMVRGSGRGCVGVAAAEDADAKMHRCVGGGVAACDDLTRCVEVHANLNQCVVGKIAAEVSAAAALSGGVV